MPDVKFDHVLACSDFNVMGEPCPFFSGGACNILGWSNPDTIPEDGICDKEGGRIGPITKTSILLFDLDEDYTEELSRLHSSDSYRRFTEEAKHYSLRDVEREAVEFGLLHTKVGLKSQGGLSKRHFKKRFKPNNVGVTEDQAPSFRMRVLEFLRPKSVFSSTSPSSLKEIVALHPKKVREHYEEDGKKAVEEYWEWGILTQATNFEEEIHNGGIDCYDGLEDFLTAHEGQKILIEVDYFYSPGTYHHPNDADFGINDIKLLNVLDG